jgi:2'-hydroxybiphenyl-2-sulfinate desulfinase
MTDTAPRPTEATADRAGDIDIVWYTRCPVPTASGLAYHRGWLTEALGAHGLEVGILQDAPRELRRHHLDHQLPGLVREGGNVPALAARAEGAPTRLVGLTWIDEWQKILVRRDAGIDEPGQLRGLRLALPAWAPTRAASFPRAMSLHGYKHALGLGGLTLDDVRFVEVPTLRGDDTVLEPRRELSIFGLDRLASGEVDAVYVKGAAAAEEAAAIGAVVAVDLDAVEDRRLRVNNGTPRPLTVHQQLLDTNPDVVVDFLAQSLRAADWAAGDPDGVRGILEGETRSGPDGVATAYAPGFHTSLHPDLSPERLGLLERQKDFLFQHGFLAADVDVAAWVDPEPLARARAQVGSS